MQTATVKWIGGQQFLATSPSGHALTIDSDRQSNKAPARWSCFSWRWALALQPTWSSSSRKSARNSNRSKSSAPASAPEPPSVWTKLEVLYRLRGRLEEAAVKRAIELSEEKYCSVSATLKKSAALSWRYEILPPAS